MLPFPQIISLQQKYIHHVLDVHDVKPLQQFLPNLIFLHLATSRNTVPVLERCIPAQATEGSVEALAFAGQAASRNSPENSDGTSSTEDDSSGLVTFKF